MVCPGLRVITSGTNPGIAEPIPHKVMVLSKLEDAKIDPSVEKEIDSTGHLHEEDCSLPSGV